MRSISQSLGCLLVFVLYTVTVTASEPVVVANPTPPKHPQQPQVAIDKAGVIHVAFGAKDEVRYTHSGDGGKSFSLPIKVATIDGLALGMRRGPRIAVSGDAVCISAIGHKNGNVLLYRSTDKGKSWEAPATVNDEPGSASEGLHAMAINTKGELTCVWLDHRHKQSEVFSSTSIDSGKTWSKNVLVYHSPGGSVCECCHPSVTYSFDGKIHVMWRNSLDGKRDMYHCVSSDSGKTYGPARKLGADSWTLDRCPMDGGSIAVIDGKPVTAWRRDKTVYFLDSDGQQEFELGSGEQPWLTTSAKGPIAVWLRKRGQSLMLRQLDTKKTVEVAKAAGDPMIAAGGPNNEVVIAAWEDTSGGGKRIVCQRIELN